MPRDGSNIYHYPAGIEGIPDQVIESADYNSFLTDVEQDLNTPRPILAGGTGATSADAARAALSAEKAIQVVTNYDSYVWIAGSFYSAVGATSAPVAGHAFSGIVYGVDGDNVVVEARDSTDGLNYFRRKVAGVWTAWGRDVPAGNEFTTVNFGNLFTDDIATLNPANGLLAYYNNGGNHTIIMPSVDCIMAVLCTNLGGAGAVFFSGNTRTSGLFPSGQVSSTLTAGYKYLYSITRINGLSFIIGTQVQF